MRGRICPTSSPSPRLMMTFVPEIVCTPSVKSAGTLIRQCRARRGTAPNLTAVRHAAERHVDVLANQRARILRVVFRIVDEQHLDSPGWAAKSSRNPLAYFS